MTPFGDHALRFALPDGTGRRALFEALRAIPGVVDVVLTESLGMVVGDASAEAVAAVLAAPLRNAAGATRRHVVPVVYDGEDLDVVASLTGLSRREIIAAHTGRDHVVSMLGFQPGFAYLRDVDPRLATVPRRESPRTRVPRGSVALAAGYTGLYPFASPGGWQLLGRTGFRPFDARGAAFEVDDRVRFEEIDALEEPEPSEPEAAREVPSLHVVATRVLGPALLVDGGRCGHMHAGIPRGGALVPEALARANLALGNAPGACAIEVHGGIELAARGGRLAMSGDHDGAAILEDGASRTFATAGRARVVYVAVPGGFDVPVVLGSRSTLLAAAIGGLGGRALRRGDALAPAQPAAHLAAPTSEEARPEGPIAISLGPDLDHVPREAIETIMAASFRVSPASDRTGTRLEGPAIAVLRGDRPSGPMVPGAIELTPRGLIVLGPDHPTTGGYPVVGVVRAGSLGDFFATPIGGSVRFST